MLARLGREIGSDLRANGFPQGGISAFLRGYFTHAGCYRLISHRLARSLLLGNPAMRFAGRVLDARATARTGCFVSPHAMLEPGVIMPHATGIVIGIGVRVATEVTIYQGVTLGGETTRAGGYPSVARGAILYAGAKLIGDVRIGRNAVVGANAVVLRTVPDDAVAVGIPARILPPRARRSSGVRAVGVPVA